MDTSYALVIFWFFFACITFGCIVGGDVPKQWNKPSKSEVFKAWLIAVFWPIAFCYIISQWMREKVVGCIQHV